MNKIKSYKALFICLIFAIIIVAILIGIKYFKMYTNEHETKRVLAEINQKNENAGSTEVISEINQEIKGYKVVGIIRIPKIDLEYPILETTSIDSLNVSVTKFWGNEINEIGNVTLAGHNNLNGTSFGRIKKLEVGDKIYLTDIRNNVVEYTVFQTYVIDPNDITCILPVQDGTRETTLITCTTGGKNRYIVKAREEVSI